MTKADTDILATVREAFSNAPPARLGVAVSGGGDSVALLHILSRCFEPDSVELFAVTVDHGLRKEAADEALAVQSLAARLNIPHTTLRWQRKDTSGNLQEKAREARYQLISEWAKGQDISVFAIGHTADDQAETVLMRLARAAGVDGLAAMPLKRTIFGINLIRPMLGLTRKQLRDYLLDQGMEWTEDPTNHDMAFERVRTRKALKHLSDLGITSTVLSDVAGNMARVREALDWYCFLAARDMAAIRGGDVLFDLRKFRALPDEIARRLLVRAISWVGGSVHGPRRVPLGLALESIRAGRACTLAGCNVMRHDRYVWVCREFEAVKQVKSRVGDIWDGRWQAIGTGHFEYEIRALGPDGLSECPNWRETGHPRMALMASPSVWLNDQLVAAPLAGKPDQWKVELAAGDEEFFATLISH